MLEFESSELVKRHLLADKFQTLVSNVTQGLERENVEFLFLVWVHDLAYGYYLDLSNLKLSQLYNIKYFQQNYSGFASSVSSSIVLHLRPTGD